MGFASIASRYVGERKHVPKQGEFSGWLKTLTRD